MASPRPPSIGSVSSPAPNTIPSPTVAIGSPSATFAGSRPVVATGSPAGSSPPPVATRPASAFATRAFGAAAHTVLPPHEKTWIEDVLGKRLIPQRQEFEAHLDWLRNRIQTYPFRLGDGLATLKRLKAKLRVRYRQLFFSSRTGFELAEEALFESVVAGTVSLPRHEFIELLQRAETTIAEIPIDNDDDDDDGGMRERANHLRLRLVRRYAVTFGREIMREFLNDFSIQQTSADERFEMEDMVYVLAPLFENVRDNPANGEFYDTNDQQEFATLTLLCREKFTTQLVRPNIKLIVGRYTETIEWNEGELNTKFNDLLEPIREAMADLNNPLPFENEWFYNISRFFSQYLACTDTHRVLAKLISHIEISAVNPAFVVDAGAERAAELITLLNNVPDLQLNQDLWTVINALDNDPVIDFFDAGIPILRAVIAYLCHDDRITQTQMRELVCGLLDRTKTCGNISALHDCFNPLLDFRARAAYKDDYRAILEHVNTLELPPHITAPFYTNVYARVINEFDFSRPELSLEELVQSMHTMPRGFECIPPVLPPLTREQWDTIFQYTTRYRISKERMVYLYIQYEQDMERQQIVHKRVKELAEQQDENSSDTSVATYYRLKRETILTRERALGETIALLSPADPTTPEYLRSASRFRECIDI